MPLFETFLSENVVVPEYRKFDIESVLQKVSTRRLIVPGQEKDVTPLSMRLQTHYDFWGCRYTAVAYDDEDGSGTLRMMKNTPFSWGLVYDTEKKRIVAVIGSHTFPMGPEPMRNVFVFARRTRIGTVTDKIIEWQPRRDRP